MHTIVRCQGEKPKRSNVPERLCRVNKLSGPFLFFTRSYRQKKKIKEACFTRVSNVYLTPFSVDSWFSQSIKENCNRVKVGRTWLHVNKGVTRVYSEQGTGTVDLEQHFYIIAKNERAKKQNETEEAHQCHYLGILKNL